MTQRVAYGLAAGAHALARRLDIAILVAMALGVLLRVVLFVQVVQAPFGGDEVAYVDGAKALSNALRDLAALHAPDTAELRRDLIGSGWFMPGTSLVLTPLYLLVPHAGVGLARAWLGLVVLGVTVATVLDVRRVLGRWWALGLAVAPGLVPMWLLFGLTAYGDVLAGLTATLLITRLIAVLGRAGRGRPPSRRDGAVLGLLAVATLYLRSSSTVLVLGVGLVGLLAVRWAGRRALAAVLVAAGVFVGLLAPWSIAASATFHTRVITTTSVPMGLANTFGDRDQVCYGPCDPGSTIWFAPVRYAREVARATGVSEVTVLSQMSAYARRDVTAHSYARQVIADWHRYRDDPAGFLFRLHPPGRSAPHWIRTWTERAFTWVLRLAALGMLVVTRRSRRLQLLSVLVKVCLLGLLVQPFVHMAGTRYWTTAAPLAALSAMLALTVVGGWVVDRVRPGSRPWSRVAPWSGRDAEGEAVPSRHPSRAGVRMWFTEGRRGPGARSARFGRQSGPTSPSAPRSDGGGASRLLVAAQAVPAVVGVGAVVAIRLLA